MNMKYEKGNNSYCVSFQFSTDDIRLGHKYGSVAYFFQWATPFKCEQMEKEVNNINNILTTILQTP